MGNTRVDTAALRAASQRFDTVADLLAGASVNRLRFDGSLAGRAHTARGDAVRSALQGLAAAVSHWSRAAEELAAALRVTADRYAEAELRAAAR
ncbi:type VII secretion target [Mycobacterium sp. shizuoka-1]|uniref:type VII secretion target n=1 Tax=Mycobacterium sp. shizuoka-1 TaxID=2039281 RepID=UPI000C0636DD|nr:type VII secretion target [Mycobacterium sp. shizuoka-1]GAY14963.1 hypothetical protein MSZK_16890 [Mycobacterium sp. shizuoka-1]